jgi:hypothetical protein
MRTVERANKRSWWSTYTSTKPDRPSSATSRPGCVRLDSECLDLRIELSWRSIMDENRDTLMRMAAFEHVRILDEVHDSASARIFAHVDL